MGGGTAVLLDHLSCLFPDLLCLLLLIFKFHHYYGSLPLKDLAYSPCFWVLITDYFCYELNTNCNSIALWIADNAQIPKRHPPYIWIVGSLGIILVLILVGIVGYACFRWLKCFSRSRSSHPKDPGGKVSHKFHILGKSSFCCASGRYICCSSADWKQANGESTDNQTAIPKGSTVSVLGHIFLLSVANKWWAFLAWFVHLDSLKDPINFYWDSNILL